MAKRSQVALPIPPRGMPPDPAGTSERASRPHLDLWDGVTTLSGLLGGPPNHSWTSRRASRLFPDLREGLPTLSGPLGQPLEPSRTTGRAS